MVDSGTYEEERKYPLISDRYKVVFIDGMVVIGLMVTYSIIIGSLENQTPAWVRVALYSSLFLYEPFCLAFFGKTVGHWSGKLKVVREQNENRNISIFVAIVRALVKYLLGFISLFSITAENRGRAIHDMAAGSIVLFEE